MKPDKVPPPLSEDEMMERANGIAGLTIGELGRRHHVAIPPDTKRHKGLVGQLMETVLGCSAGSLGEPDFLEIGVELKTLPVLKTGQPKESTFICTIVLTEMADTDFEDSLVWRKLRRMLWMPVQADPDTPLPHRRVGMPILWSPSDAQARILRDDYERVATLVLQGDIDSVTGHLGTYLQVRPKGADSSVRQRAPGQDGGYQWTGPRGFYLRPQLTTQLLSDYR